jgi:hypothetical protein
LISRLIGAVTRPGDLVVDPAAGSFVVMHAANELGRSFIGCDIAYPAQEVASAQPLVRDFSTKIELSRELSRFVMFGRGKKSNEINDPSRIVGGRSCRDSSFYPRVKTNCPASLLLNSSS